MYQEEIVCNEDCKAGGRVNKKHDELFMAIGRMDAIVNSLTELSSDISGAPVNAMPNITSGETRPSWCLEQVLTEGPDTMHEIMSEMDRIVLEIRTKIFG